MTIFRFALLMLLSSLLLACATKRIDLIAEGEVEILKVKSQAVEFSKVDVHQHGEHTNVEVVVRPHERTRHFTVGKIQIGVKQPGRQEEQLVTSDPKIDKHRIGSKLQHAHFYISIPHTLPTGTVITVAYEETAN